MILFIFVLVWRHCFETVSQLVVYRTRELCPIRFDATFHGEELCFAQHGRTRHGELMCEVLSCRLLCFVAPRQIGLHRKDDSLVEAKSYTRRPGKFQTFEEDKMYVHQSIIKVISLILKVGY